MRSVKSTIPAAQFFHAMFDMSEWQRIKGIKPAFSNYRRTPDGDILFHVAFVADGQAETFVKRFGGDLAVDGCPFAGPDANAPAPTAWIPRRRLAA
jgi:hypothetical protein